MFQIRRNSLTHSLTRSHGERFPTGGKSLENLCDNKQNEWVSGTVCRLDALTKLKDEPHITRMTGIQLLQCFKQRYSPQDSVVNIKEKKKTSQGTKQNFKVDHNISQILQLQIQYTAKKICETGQALPNLSRRESLLNRLDTAYWESRINALENRLSINISQDLI